jgi:hypothetical protein
VQEAAGAPPCRNPHVNSHVEEAEVTAEKTSLNLSPPLTKSQDPPETEAKETTGSGTTSTAPHAEAEDDDSQKFHPCISATNSRVNTPRTSWVCTGESNQPVDRCGSAEAKGAPADSRMSGSSRPSKQRAKAAKKAMAPAAKKQIDDAKKSL